MDTFENGLLEYFTLKELNEFPDYIQRHGNFIVERKEEEGGVKVIYFKEVGYKRKGMSRKFCKDFKNGKPYLGFETIKKVYKYLQADHKCSLEELQQSFQKNFITNCIKAKSIFYSSW